MKRSTTLATALLAATGIAVAPATAQWAENPQPLPTSASGGRILLGATAGSFVGLMTWGLVGPSPESIGPSILFLGTTTTLGAALGGLIATRDDDHPGFGRLLAGATLGLLGGIVVASAIGSSNQPDAAIVVGFAVGQGAVTALVGSAGR